MVKRYLGAVIASFLLAGLASLTLSGVAYAEEGPAIAADCAVGLPSEAHEDGEELAVDAGVSVGELRLGLGTDTGELPAVGDAASGVLSAETPAVAEAAGGACELVETTAKTANEVGEPAVRLLSRDERPDSAEAPQPPVDEPAENPVPGDEQQPSEPEDAAVPVEGESRPVEAPSLEPIAHTQEVVAPLPTIELPAIPPAAAQRGPDLNSDDKKGVVVGEKNAGRAHALPSEPAEQPKLPFLLAIATLAAVAAVLVRRWITRVAG